MTMDDRGHATPGPLVWPNVILGLAFLAFLVVGIVTVLLPELSDDPDPAMGESPTTTSSSPSEDNSD